MHGNISASLPGVSTSEAVLQRAGLALAGTINYRVRRDNRREDGRGREHLTPSDGMLAPAPSTTDEGRRLIRIHIYIYRYKYIRPLPPPVEKHGCSPHNRLCGAVDLSHWRVNKMMLSMALKLEVSQSPNLCEYGNSRGSSLVRCLCLSRRRCPH